jgi:hypothetical protein
MMSLSSVWEEQLVRELALSLSDTESPEQALAGARALKAWLLDDAESDRAIPTGLDALEPFLTLLRAYQRLNRSASQLLLARGYAGAPPVLQSEFADTTVASLLREAYLDIDVAVDLAIHGMDVQTATIMRHLLDVNWKAMVLVRQPSHAAKLADVAFADSYSSHKKAAAKHWSSLNPGALLSEVVRIEVDLDGVEASEREEAISSRMSELKRLYYDWLSNVAHGSGFMVTLSTFRSATGRTADAPPDPFAAIGQPTARGARDVSLLLSTAWRFWNYFPRILMPAEQEGEAIGRMPAASTSLDAEGEAMRLAVHALNVTMVRLRDVLFPPEQDEAQAG